MSSDESRRSVSKPKQIEKVELPPGPARDFRDALYDLYLRAGTYTLSDLAALIAADDDLPGSPGRDAISGIVSGRETGARQEDVESVATVLARLDDGRDRHPAAKRIIELWIAAKAAPAVSVRQRLGKPVGEWNPMDLEVHRAIDMPQQEASLPMLPDYVSRAHDVRIWRAMDEAAGGKSRMVTLVGGSSTGKTRACWEAIQRLAKNDDRWWVWHPKDPSKPGAAAAAIGEVGPMTVVWLNEAQHYLLPADPMLGERIAAGLRTLLEDPGRAPVLVLATLWPEPWSTLTTRPNPGQLDPYAQARELLDGTDVRVPETFTSVEVRDLAARTDPRLRQAAENAEAGRVTQYLAGVPELLSRYHNAEGPARAVIDVAIDARRLGHLIAIPHSLLDQAAPGYLTDHEWSQAADDWLEQALAYTATPCKGVLGPVTRIRPRPGDPPTGHGQPTYRLADYLDQTGRTERAGEMPPASFWTAAATITDPDILRTLATAAADRARYRHSARLYRLAAELGDTVALRMLAGMRERAGDGVGAEALYERAAELGDTVALKTLAGMRERAGDGVGAEALYEQAAERGDLGALKKLAGIREAADDWAGAEALYEQAAEQGDILALFSLIEIRERAGDRVAADALYQQVAGRGSVNALGMLAARRWAAGDEARAEDLAVQAAKRGDTRVLLMLAEGRESAGDQVGATALYQQAAERGDTTAVLWLSKMREKAGDWAGVEALAVLATEWGDTSLLLRSAARRAEAGDRAGAEALYLQAADRGDRFGLWGLSEMREKAGDRAGAEAAAVQAARRGDTSVLLQLARLRDEAG
ncbi:tetratricopeptide repeat protein, partial [Micromonospora profundi]|uniref:tetratricopeptide repeat protein n=1 Tax=Micromonospora profundi TaxID=1420889 RepID=UPI0036496745